MLDIKVVADYLFERHPHYDHAALILESIITKRVEGFFPAHGVTTLFYFADKFKGSAYGVSAVGWTIEHFNIAPCNELILKDAFRLGFSDFEDAVLTASAQDTFCSYIVTRNVQDFIKSPVPVLSPKEFLSHLNKI